METFEPEMRAALASYDRHVVCIEKIPEDCETTLRSLLEKAIKAFVTRGPDLRHGIALDRHVTVILSQSEGPRPLCAIYFNLFSPYAKKAPTKAEAAQRAVLRHHAVAGDDQRYRVGAARRCNGAHRTRETDAFGQPVWDRATLLNIQKETK